MATFLTPIGVLNFPSFFTPKRNEQNPKQIPRYTGVLLFDDVGTSTTAYQELRRGVKEAIEEKWGAAKAADRTFIATLRLPFRDASEKSYTGFEDGDKFINAWSPGFEKDDVNWERPKTPPEVVDLHGHPIQVPGDVFAGQLARFTVRPFAYDNNGNKGVSFGLEHVQIVKQDMERIDGRRSGEQAFAGADLPADQMRQLGIDPNAPAGGSAPPSASDSDDDLPF